MFLRTFNSEFSYIENGLLIKNKINITLVNNGRLTYEKLHFIELKLEIVYF